MRVPAAVPVTKVLLITERVNAECDVELEWADLVSEYPEACAVQKEVSKGPGKDSVWLAARGQPCCEPAPMSGCCEGADIRCYAIT